MFKLTNLTIGILLNLLAALSFAFMSLFFKLGVSFDPSQKLFSRSLVLTLLSWFLILNHKKMKISYFGKLRNQPFLFARTFFGLIGMLAAIYTIDTLILPDSDILAKLSFIFVIILSSIFLGERTTYVHWLLIILTFTGLIFVIKPSFNIVMIPYIIGLFGALCAGIAYLMIRIMSVVPHRAEHPLTIMFYLSFFGCITTIPFIIFQDYSKIPVIEYVYLFAAGASAAIAQLALTYSYRFAAAKEISIYGYFSVLFNAILGFIVYQSLPDGYSILGYITIVLAGFLMYLYNLKLSNQEEKSANKTPAAK